MFTTASKLYFGIAALCLGAAALFGWGSHGGLNGVLSFGLNGGVGSLGGYVMLLIGGAAMAFLGGLMLAVRDADDDALAQVSGTAPEPAPAPRPARGTSYWPAIGALGAATAVVGLVVNTQLFLLGIIIGVVTLLEWMVQAWSERASADAEANRRIRNRVMYPLEVPVFGAIAIFFVVLGVSRVLLALPKNGSVIGAIAVALLIFVTVTVLASVPRAGRLLVGVVCVIGALGVLVGGIVAAAHGERKIGGEEHEVQFTPADRNQSPAGALIPTTLPPTPDSTSAN